MTKLKAPNGDVVEVEDDQVADLTSPAHGYTAVTDEQEKLVIRFPKGTEVEIERK